MTTTEKKRKLAKNKKRTWRSTDINDVETFLESSRLEERIGQVKIQQQQRPISITLSIPHRSVEAKADNELYTVDTSSVADAKHVPIKLRRKLNALKPARCFSGLENTSKIKDPLTNRAQVRQKKNVTKLKGASAVSKKPPVEPKPKAKKGDQFEQDLWAPDAPALVREQKKKQLQNEWFSEQLVDHHLKGTGTNLRRVPGTARKKTTLLDAIAAPHPGTSYNPSLEAHRKLIGEVVEREEKIIAEEEHLERVVGRILKKVPAGEHDREYLSEMSAGLPVPLNPDPVDEEEEEDAATVAEYSTLNPPVEVKRKARAARRKVKEEREKQLAREKAKHERRLLTDIDRVNRLKTDVVKREMKVANRRNKEDQLKKEKPLNAIRLARQKYVEPDEELVMPADLAGSLRRMKPQGSIIRDRFASLQKRNILAPNKAQGVRKRHKVKSYIKNTHKGFLEKPIIQPRKGPTPKKRKQ